MTPHELSDDEYERLSNGVGAALEEDGPDTYTVRINPIGEGDITEGGSGKRTLWDRETLKDAVESGAFSRDINGDDGTGGRIIKGQGGPGHFDLTEQVPPENILARVEEWEYEDGVGPVGEAELVDADIAERIDLGLLDVSADMVRRLNGYDDGHDAYEVDEVLAVPRITVVERGASTSASIEPATAEALGYSPDNVTTTETTTDPATVFERLSVDLGRLKRLFPTADTDDGVEQNAIHDSAIKTPDPDVHVAITDQQSDGTVVSVDSAYHSHESFYVSLHPEGDEYPDASPALGASIGEVGPFSPGTDTGVTSVTLDDSLERSRTLYATLHSVTADGSKGDLLTIDGETYISDAATVTVDEEVLTEANPTTGAESPADTTDVMTDNNLQEQLAEARTRIDSLESDLDEKDDRIEALEDDLDAKESTIDDLEDTKETLTDDLETLEAEIEPWQEMLAQIAAGDSMLDASTIAETQNFEQLSATVLKHFEDEEADASPMDRLQEQLSDGLAVRGEGDDSTESVEQLTDDDLDRGDDLAYDIMGADDIMEASEEQLSARDYVRQKHGVDPARCETAAELRRKVDTGGDA